MDRLPNGEPVGEQAVRLAAVLINDMRCVAFDIMQSHICGLVDDVKATLDGLIDDQVPLPTN